MSKKAKKPKKTERLTTVNSYSLQHGFDRRTLKKHLIAADIKPARRDGNAELYRESDLDRVVAPQAPKQSAPALPAQDTSDLARGAAGALARLEDEEKIRYAESREASASGDLVRCKIALENWLRVSESLRKYDLQVEASKRDAQHMIPRGVIQEHLKSLFFFFRMACRMASKTLAPKLAGADAVTLLESMDSHLLNAMFSTVDLLGQQDCPAKLPEWILTSASEEFENWFEPEPDEDYAI